MIKTTLERLSIIVVLSFASVLLYLAAGVLSLGILTTILTIIAQGRVLDHSPLAAIMVVVSWIALFSAVVAGITYGILFLAYGVIYPWPAWYGIHLGSIALGASLIYSTSLLPWHVPDLRIVLIGAGMIGALVGGIQWWFIRQHFRTSYVWIFAMVHCWMLWGGIAILMGHAIRQD